MHLKLTKKQTKAWKLLDNPEFTRYCFDGGSRCGKTFFIAVKLLQILDRFPNARILVCRKNYNHASTTVWGQTLKPLVDSLPNLSYQLSPTIEVTHSNGATLIVSGLDNKERIDKILGDEFTHIFVNEATQCTWDQMQTLVTRLARNAWDIDGNECKRMIILDCNPKGPRHWLHRVGVEHVDPETLEPLTDAGKWSRLHWTPYDNPHLPADYLDALRALPEVMRLRMLEGRWTDYEGIVYPEFKTDVHTFSELPATAQSGKRVAAIDFGFTNPFVHLSAMIDHDGVIWVYRSYYKRKVICEDHAKVIKAWGEQFTWTTADHDAEDRATMQKHGVFTRRAKKEVKTGIEAVKKRFVEGRLMIHESCTPVLNELSEYRWQDDVDGKNSKEEPVKDNDHAMDALRYLVMELDGAGGSRMIM